MKIRTGRARLGETAQALPEFAVVLPLVMVIMTAVIEFGFYFNTMARLGTAANTGARTGSAGGNDAAVTTAVNNALGSLASTATVTLQEYSASDIANNTPGLPGTSSVTGSPRTTGNYLAVQVSVPYTSFTRLVNLGTIAGIEKVKDARVMVINY